LGLDVFGVDGSVVGLEKAHRLAASRGVTIHTEVVDLADFEPEPGRYQSVVSIFAHLPSTVRQRLYPRIQRALKSGGLILVEAYSEEQVAFATGGPRDTDMLMSVAKIRKELSGFEPILLREIEREVVEGKYHTGRAAVVQFIGRKIA
jgi:cyclopropane fatty-acyl-phospholipid synthase-like methyltransferase